MNPVTEEVICHVQEGDKADVDKAVAAATKVKTKICLNKCRYSIMSFYKIITINILNT